MIGFHGDGDQVLWITTGGPLCPDLLRTEMLGVADNRRGRIVLLFFRLLDLFMPVRQP